MYTVSRFKTYSDIVDYDYPADCVWAVDQYAHLSELIAQETADYTSYRVSPDLASALIMTGFIKHEKITDSDPMFIGNDRHGKEVYV